MLATILNGIRARLEAVEVRFKEVYKDIARVQKETDVKIERAKESITFDFKREITKVLNRVVMFLPKQNGDVQVILQNNGREVEVPSMDAFNSAINEVKSDTLLSPSENGDEGQILISDGEGGTKWADNIDVPQSDWNEADESSSSYIKNKPDIALLENLLLEIKEKIETINNAPLCSEINQMIVSYFENKTVKEVEA